MDTADPPEQTPGPDVAPGLHQGAKPGDGAREPHAGSDLIDHAAAGGALMQQEADDLVGYYLSNDGLPGDKDTVPLKVKIGNGPKAREFEMVVRPIEWSEWQDSRTRATDEKTGEFEAYVAASYNVARALVKPQLGPTVMRQQAEAKAAPDQKITGPDGTRIDPPKDGAHLLRRMFHRQSGIVLELSSKVLELSKLNSDNASVKEVEAGKL